MQAGSRQMRAARAGHQGHACGGSGAPAAARGAAAWRRGGAPLPQPQPRRGLAVRADAAPSDGGAPGRGPAGRGAAQQGLYTLLNGGAAPVGAPHGQGFTSFLPAGGVLRVDVDTLNENLRVQGKLRLRHAMRPDEAFGMILCFENTVADMYAVRAAAWQALATARGLPLSEGQLAHPELHSMPPEVAAVRMLRWADSLKHGRELAFEHASLAACALQEQAAPRAGVREWLDVLGKFNVPCALVSALDRQTVQAALARMGLHDHFSAMVTAEDELETLSQRLLSASVKLGRPPNMCVAVESSPDGVTAAHNCSMKAIGVQGPYRAYQLKTADLTCSSLAELTVYNIRRLFANRGNEMMDLAQQADWQQWDCDKRRGTTRRLGIATGP